MIACVAIVGPKNNPLLVHPLKETPSDPLKFDYVIYVCLDAIDSIILDQAERGRGAQQAGAAPQDTESPTDRRFLGLVSVTPEFHVYAYLTANLTKILVLVASAARATAAPRLAADVARLCLKVEKAYKHAVSNPFYNPGSMLDSERFKRGITALVDSSLSNTSAQAGLAASALL